MACFSTTPWTKKRHLADAHLKVVYTTEGVRCCAVPDSKAELFITFPIDR